MLTIIIPGNEFWDEAKEQFVMTDDTTLELEHSLASLSKWESIWEKPFLSGEEKTNEETFSYIECMSLDSNVDPIVYKSITKDNVLLINEYISRKFTATTFHEPPGSQTRRNREVITAEIVYYWMTVAVIPFECQYWHLNRLLTLIRVISLKNEPKKKMGRREQAAQQRMLNAQRQAKLNTSG